MNNTIKASEMACLLGFLFITLMFSGSSALPLEIAGNSAYLVCLLTGVIYLGVTALMVYLARDTGLYEACDTLGWASSLFTLAFSLIFLTLSATSLRALLDMMEAYALPSTPRSVDMLFILLVTLPVCFMGIASLSRALRIMAPVLAVLYIIMLFYSLRFQADWNNIYPLLGNGLPAMGKSALTQSSAFIWLLVLYIEMKQMKKPLRVAWLSVGSASVLAAVGCLAYTLLFPVTTPYEPSFPLHQVAAMGGYSRYFQRMKAVFTFLWLPAFTAAVTCGLIYSARSLAQALKLEDPRPLLTPLLVVVASLALPTAERSPLWLYALLGTRLVHYIAAPVLLAPILVSFILTRKRRRANRA